MLITRAKERLSIFTSLKPSDITNQSIGAQVWKRYLDFAKTGQLQGLDSADVNCQVAGSLNQWFHDRLTQDGFGVTSQVGVSEWRVDLGIRHDANPGHYIKSKELVTTPTQIQGICENPPANPGHSRGMRMAY